MSTSSRRLARNAAGPLAVCTAIAALVGAAQAAEVTVHLTSALGATTEERWDGWLQVRGGELVDLSSWHFLDHDPLAGPQGGFRGAGVADRVAEIIEPNAWRVETTKDGVDG